MSETILITGGTGFAGSHLVELLVATTRADIHVTTFSKNGNPGVDTFLPAENIHQLNLIDPQATLNLVAQLKPTQIYHLAALSSVGYSFAKAESVIANNNQLQLSLLEAVRQAAPQARVLVVGSAQEYDVNQTGPDSSAKNLRETHPLGPANPYGVSKVTQDLLGLSYVYAYDLDIVRVRPFNHIGERQPLGFVVADFAHQIAQLETKGFGELKVGNLAAVRDFSDVKDVAKAYVLLLDKGKKGDVYNVGSGHGHSVQEMLDSLLAHSSAEITVVQDPSRQRPSDIATIVANIDKLRKLGWQPTTDLTGTLERVLNYWRGQFVSH